VHSCLIDIYKYINLIISVPILFSGEGSDFVIFKTITAARLLFIQLNQIAEYEKPRSYRTDSKVIELRICL